MSHEQQYKRAAGERLSQVIRFLELNQTQFASRFRVPNSSVTDYVQGESWIPLRIALALKSDHKISLDWLYFGDDSGQAPEITRRLERGTPENPPPAVRISTSEKRRRKSGS